MLKSASALFERKRSRGKVRVRRELGILSVSAYLIGGMIGTGVFISPMGVAVNSGSPGVAVLVWLGCGIVATMAAFCFAELGTTFPYSGSSYIYVKLAFGDFPAFLFEWVDVILRKSTTLAVRYLTVAVYLLQPLYPHCAPPTPQLKLLAAFALITLSYLNAMGVKWRSAFQILTTATKLGALLLLFSLAMHHLASGKINHFAEPFSGAKASVGRIILAFSFGLYAYSGWDTMNTAVEEIKQPNRVLPFSIIMSILVVTVAYVLVNIAYFIVLEYEEVVESEVVAVVFAQKFFPAGAWSMSVLVSISAIGACNAAFFQVSRYYFAIAREGQLPRFLASIHPNNNSPIPAICLVTILIMLCIVSGNIYQLLAYYGILKWSMVAFPIAAQIRLRIKYPEIHRPLKLPLIFPIVTLLVMLALLVIPIYENWFNSVVAILLALLSVPIYAFFFMWKDKPMIIRIFLSYIDGRLTQLSQKCFLVNFAEEIHHSLPKHPPITRKHGRGSIFEEDRREFHSVPFNIGNGNT